MSGSGAAHAQVPNQAENVNATDGTFEDKITITWSPPGAGGGNPTTYDFYRAVAPSVGCQPADLLTSVAHPTTFVEDLAATPGLQYAYSVIARNGSGSAACSNVDNGYRKISPPTNVQASDGTSPSQVTVTWTAPSGVINNYILYRSTTPETCGTVLDNNVPSASTSYIDNTATPGTVYYYTLRTNSPVGQSRCSAPDNNSVDSGHALGPPINVSATDGTHNDKIVVSWTAPPAGGPITGYNLFRDTNPTSCTSLLQAGLAPGATSFDDTTASAGTTYFYSLLSTSASGNSVCSNFDSGFVQQVARTISGTVLSPNGTGVPGVQVTNGADVVFTDNNGAYTISNVFAGNYTVVATKTGYVFSPNGFANPVAVTNASLSGINFGSTCATGYVIGLSGLCLFENGLPSAPTNLQASDGTSLDHVEVTWSRSEGAASYKIYRSITNGVLGDLIVSGLTDTQYLDTSAIPGRQYYYTAVATNVVGDSTASNTDPGYRADITGTADCDADGVSDNQEIIDGTTVCDAGSFRLHLQSPAYTKYNTFISQFAYLELTGSGSLPVDVTIKAYNLDGEVINTRSVSIQPREQVDIDVNALVNFEKDIYGIIQIDFDDTVAGATLQGRKSVYRLNPGEDRYSFAFARELRNPTRGSTYAISNSIDPQGLGFLVPNWAEVINLDSVDREFTHNIYDRSGALVSTFTFIVPAFGERDVQAGHAIGQGVYLNEITPSDGATNYLAFVTRYSSNDFGGAEAKTYNYASSSDARAGNGDKQFLTTSALSGSCWVQTNWVEVANTREIPVEASLIFRGQGGQVVGQDTVELVPHSQFHFNASALLPAGTFGSVEVTSSQSEGLYVQSAVYYHDSCGNNSLQTAYITQGQIVQRDIITGSFNTFIGLQNQLQIVSTDDSGGNYSLALSSLGGGEFYSVTNNLAALNSDRFDLSNANAFSTSANQLGSVVIESDNPGAILVQSVRFREVDGEADFALPIVFQ